MSLEQIEQMVRAANPVPDVAILAGTMSHRGHVSPNGHQVGDTDERETPTTSADGPAGERQPGRRWMLMAAATIVVLGLGLLAVNAVRGSDSVQTDTVPTTPAPSTNPATTAPLPVAPLPPPGPFVGVWLSTDTDGSSQTMQIVHAGTDEHEVVVRDGAATRACSGAPSTMTGTGRLEADDVLVVARPAVTCDDGSTPVIGPPPQAEIANYTLDLDGDADELVDTFGVVWWREGSERATASPATTVTAVGTPTAAQVGVIRQLVEAVDAAAADHTRDAQRLADVFTEDAVVIPFEGWDGRPGSELDHREAWIAHLQAWGYEADLGDCWIDGGVVCSVRGRWNGVLAEADEWWNVEFVGDRIRALTIVRPETRHGDPVLPLSLAELDGWEEWLQQTDPETAARLVPAAQTTPPPPVPRYDPALADDITASIQQYLTQRPAGDEITVTADRVEFGDRLVGLISNMARADGRTYVIAGRYETEMDLLMAPEKAVLAAFDDAGTELWRTDLDGGPLQVVAVNGDVWVRHGDGRLSRIDAADGRVLDQADVEDMAGIVGGFGSVWVQTHHSSMRTGDSSGTSQLIRVAPDMSTTTVELPQHVLSYDDELPDPEGAVAGPDAIWVPLGEGGVALVDPDTLAVTVTPRDEIGHDVLKVGFDDDVAYVASSDQVTSIVGGEVGATTSTGEIWYLGHVDGVFGVLQPGGRFSALRATAPMVVDVRRVSEEGGASEIEGEAWVETGENYDLRRLELLPAPDSDGG